MLHPIETPCVDEQFELAIILADTRYGDLKKRRTIIRKRSVRACFFKKVNAASLRQF
jgi:hypothetical protein